MERGEGVDCMFRKGNWRIGEYLHFIFHHGFLPIKDKLNSLDTRENANK